jgi:hypothetical protein
MKKFEFLGRSLMKEEQKKIKGGNEVEKIDGCSSTCITNRDCPEDRKCASGTCGTETVYTCHRY